MTHPIDRALAFDEALDAVRRAIMAPDGPMPLGMIERDGVVFPAFTTAPPDLPRFFALFCGMYAERTCLVDGDERLSFEQVLGLARRAAHGLRARHGVTPGTHVGLAARNSAAWVVSYMGIVMAGGVACLLNGFWTGSEMVEAIVDTDCRLVLADRPRCVALGAAGLDDGRPVLCIESDEPVEIALAAVLGGDDAILPLPGPDAPATILFTSGSTGRCRGALSDHRAKIQAALNFACSSLAAFTLFARRGDPPAPPSATLLSLPLFHVTAEVSTLLHSFAIGRKMVVMPRWDTQEALRLIAAERITYFTGVPFMAIELARHPARAGFDLASLADIAVGGAPRPATQVTDVHAGLPAGLAAFGYGLTETNAIGAGIIREACLARPDSPGRPTPPLVDLAIFGEDDRMLPQGETGEIGIRSIAAIRGYWNRPEDMAGLFTASGHVRTGDIGYLDADNYLVIVDRRKDIIIRGGENVACPEVEAALLGVRDVEDCAVFGIPDERLGEVPVAVVTLRPGSAQTVEAILAALTPRLAPYKRPSKLIVSAVPLPRLGSEKIDKRALRAAWLEEA